MKKYWFNLNPDTFVWKNRSNILLYNSATKISIEFNYSPELHSIIEKLSSLSNLYCIQIDQTELSVSNVKEFIDRIIKSNSGTLSEITNNQQRPIQFPPLLNLQCDRDKLKQDTSRSIGEKVITYLNHVDIYFNHQNNINLKKHIENLSKFLKPIPPNQHICFNIILNSASSFNGINTLINNLKDHNSSIILQIDSSLLKNISDKFNIPDDLRIKIIHNASRNEEVMYKALKNTKHIESKISWQFNIHSESEYYNCVSFIEKEQLDNTEIVPEYNGVNLAFFEENIFLNKEDLANPNLDKREVFAHQAMNTNNFGKIIIQSDGNIYSNKHIPPLGNLQNSLKEILTKEMYAGTSWFKIRDMEPCNNCIYQWLCPSPSDYEIEIGKPNLCHVRV
ncbi:TIGR04150 pseudo-rSAM protein [Ancylomarina salipaludis]|uniref:TIGR04150 pseudo-rSAM protein n=1 Tax=Ancylomarina salipaludis TaxID=2501299 RepID=A0A4Q1JLJ7_9BACT|nr:TIGR04150 pseudo-rSAM protein [Ancylomarina salipaludis]RXQ93051.1 TIGR04150 pseudo-rSAM protein [Ancylomarina salipaludis]